MKTIFDWASLGVFVGLITLFLQRSVSDNHPNDKIWHYAPPAIGCAIANYVGNKGLDDGSVGLQVLGGLILAVVVGYIFHMLKPFAR
jgi:divalent metal cation (Fe/Co/Zn/Cd) transporter